MSTVARIAAQIDLRDNLSRPLEQAARGVRQFAERARQDLNRATGEARQAWRQFGEELGRAAQSMQRSGVVMSAAVTAPISALAKTSIDAAAKLESMRASMAAITGSASAAQAQLDELERMAARTASSYDLLVSASKGLIAGFDGDVQAANRVLERFAVLSNVLGVSRGDFERLTVNLTQIGGASRLTGDELREMAAILPNLRSLLKQAFGTAQTEELAKLGITGREALEGIVRAIDAQGFRANTDTYVAQTQMLATEFFKLRAAAGEALMPIAREIVQALGPAFRQLSETIRSLTPEQRRMAAGFAAAAAAAGPLMVVLGTVGSSIGGIVAGARNAAAVWQLLARAVSASGGVLAVARAALAALTGPIGLVVAAAAALYAAWRTNFGGIRDVVQEVGGRIGAMLGDTIANVQSAMARVSSAFSDGWRRISEALQPALQFIESLAGRFFSNFASGAEFAFRLVTDIVNGAVAGWIVIFGGGWDAISNSMRASLMRMRAAAVAILSNIAQFVVSAFRAMTGWAAQIPGIGEFYTRMLDGAQARVDALRAEGAAARFLADGYQRLADAERKTAGGPKRAAAVPSAARRIAVPAAGRLAPTGAGRAAGAGTRGRARGAAGAGAQESVEYDPEIRERLEALKRLLQDIAQIQRDLAVERLRAAGAAQEDVIAMERFGKLYSQLADDLERTYVQRAAELELFKRQQEEAARAAEENRQRIEAQRRAQIELNNSVVQAATALMREREQLHFTTEEERARWEVTRGGYRDASALAKQMYVIQARLLDQARAAKQAQERWNEFWRNLVQRYREWVREQRAQAEERYEDYIRRLTQEMLELQGAQEEVLRQNLREQFQGAAAGMRGWAAAFAVAFRVEDVMRRVRALNEMRARIEQIREVARSVEQVFQRSLENLFENGFRKFFDSVIGGFRDLARQIAVEFAKQQLMRALLWGVGQIGGAKSRIEISGALAKRAAGGTAVAGTPYIVGETGPELFVPAQNGRVVPNYRLAAAGAAPVNVTVNMQVPSYTAFRRSEAQAAALVFARAARARQREGR